MIFPTPLIPGRLIRRYKRFLADIRLEDGAEITVHCANPGAMLGLTAAGARVYLSKSDNPKRKLAYSWELVEADFGAGPQWVGINTSHPNALTEEAIRSGTIQELQGYDRLRREVKYGVNSRIDILLEDSGKPPCYVEVKNVHMMRHAPLAEFPDCVTARGAKHLEELDNMVAGGARAIMVYLIQMRAERFTLAADIDSAYAAAFSRARRRGVEAVAYICDVSAEGITVTKRVPMD
ncbi:DNA/RNA nuclease SfsA [Methylovirgula sp. 4M-Z18]|uniref:DNA/RNA nuclease SfsA n=1 Tax=Methylovirgula sp. 4M-Z18 TaxID=2293567 RepID=UPI000E2F5BB5|nr:DNA/RNA nuclease SfsA [Methylovirgula sp. 4M-Z18]RFB76337.1 DNA/RNA nuclease SfsA [Methylovirgula sp. 4M-Z18]